MCLCRRQQAAKALLPLCGGPPQLRGAVSGKGLPGCYHGHAALALLLQACRRGAPLTAEVARSWQNYSHALLSMRHESVSYSAAFPVDAATMLCLWMKGSAGCCACQGTCMMVATYKLHMYSIKSQNPGIHADGWSRGCEKGRAVHAGGGPEQGHDDARCAPPAGVSAAPRPVSPRRRVLEKRR